MGGNCDTEHSRFKGKKYGSFPSSLPYNKREINRRNAYKLTCFM
jgi:hypothetical protein